MINEVCSCGYFYLLSSDYRMNYPLHSAVLDGCVQRVVDLIFSGANVNALDNGKACIGQIEDDWAAWVGYNNAPLHFAAARSFHVVQKLILAQADVNINNSGLETPLLFAVAGKFLIESIDSKYAPINSDESLEIVKELVASQANVNNCNPSGVSPLSRATYCEEHSIMEFLLESKADVNPTQDPEEVYFRSPIMRACSEFLDIDALGILIKAKADCNIQNSVGYTVLHLVLDSFPDAFQVIELLLDAGSDLNLVNDDGESPLEVGINRLNEYIIGPQLDLKRVAISQLGLALLENESLGIEPCPRPPPQTLQVICHFISYQCLLDMAFNDLRFEMAGLFNEIYLLQILTGYFNEDVPELFQNPSTRVKNLMVKWKIKNKFN